MTYALLSIYYLFLFALRTSDSYTSFIIPITFFWILFSLVSLILKNPTFLILGFLQLCFVENYDLIEIKISIPFFSIAFLLICIFWRNIKPLHLLFCTATLLFIPFYGLSEIKDLIVFNLILLLSSIKYQTFNKKFRDRKLNIPLLQYSAILIVVFWLTEYAAVFVAPEIRYSIAYGFDFRPLGFFTETTYFTALILFLILSGFINYRLRVLGLLVLIGGLGRAFFITIPFLIDRRSVAIASLLVLALSVVTVDWQSFFPRITDFNRILDFTDSGRVDRLSNAEISITPSLSFATKKTGIWALQVTNIYGLILTVIYFLLIILECVKRKLAVFFIFIVISFLHPIQFSALILLAIILPQIMKNHCSKVDYYKAFHNV